MKRLPTRKRHRSRRKYERAGVRSSPESGKEAVNERFNGFDADSLPRRHLDPIPANPNDAARQMGRMQAVAKGVNGKAGRYKPGNGSFHAGGHCGGVLGKVPASYKAKASLMASRPRPSSNLTGSCPSRIQRPKPSGVMTKQSRRFSACGQRRAREPSAKQRCAT